MVREHEQHRTRNFALFAGGDGDGGGGGGGGDIGGGGAQPLLLVTVLSPYLTLHTNRGAPPGAGGRMAHSGLTIDAVKVMWAWLGPAPGPEAAAALGVLRQWEAGGSMLRLRLVEGECDEVHAALQASTQAMPPSARSIGAFRVGHLPVVPAWD